MGKNEKDLNEKTNQKEIFEEEIISKTNLSESLLNENSKNMKSLKENLIKFNFLSDNLILDKNTFKEELKLDESKTNLNQKIYKALKEAELFSEQDQNKKGLIKELEILEYIFNQNINKIKIKNKLIESSIHNKTKIYKNIRNKIANKFDVIENLNNTSIKLKKMQIEYKSILLFFIK